MLKHFRKQQQFRKHLYLKDLNVVNPYLCLFLTVD